MEDKEIIKALEWLLTVAKNINSVTISVDDMSEIYEFINRQKAEIERLKTENKDISEQFRILDVECERLEKANEKQKTEIERLNSPGEMQVEASKKLENSIKAEAVKEFSERFKEKAWVDKTLLGFPYYQITFKTFNNLVKEMVGETNEQK